MSVYIGPYSRCELLADTPIELEEACHRLGVEVDWPVVVPARKRPFALGLGAIELSSKEIRAKIEEIEANGRGLGPKLAQICR